jgi:hypothetical protein
MRSGWETRTSGLREPAICGGRPQYPQVAASANLYSLACGLGRGAGRGGFADGVGQCLQVVGLDWFFGRVPERQPDNIPASRGRHSIGVPGTQVVAVWFDECGKRA